MRGVLSNTHGLLEVRMSGPNCRTPRLVASLFVIGQVVLLAVCNLPASCELAVEELNTTQYNHTG